MAVSDTVNIMYELAGALLSKVLGKFGQCIASSKRHSEPLKLTSCRTWLITYDGISNGSPTLSLNIRD